MGGGRSVDDPVSLGSTVAQTTRPFQGTNAGTRAR
jgi:hypothetical protein